MIVFLSIQSYWEYLFINKYAIGNSQNASAVRYEDFVAARVDDDDEIASRNHIVHSLDRQQHDELRDENQGTGDSPSSDQQ